MPHIPVTEKVAAARSSSAYKFERAHAANIYSLQGVCVAVKLAELFSLISTNFPQRL